MGLGGHTSSRGRSLEDFVNAVQNAFLPVFSDSSATQHISLDNMYVLVWGRKSDVPQTPPPHLLRCLVFVGGALPHLHWYGPDYSYSWFGPPPGFSWEDKAYVYTLLQFGGAGLGNFGR